MQIFRLNQRRTLVATPSEPQYVAFIMPDHVDTVLVRVSSSDSNCMYVSVQDIQVRSFILVGKYTQQKIGLFLTVSCI